MKKQWIPLFILSVGLISCSHHQNIHDNDKEKRDDHKLLMATLFHQKAAERDALCYQAFNWARIMLDEDMKRMGLSRQKAIVTDIDETVLDNSPYQATCILEGIDYPEKWDEWVGMAQAKPIPGALEFMNYAASQGYEIFYVTNRKEKLKGPTIKNLQEYGFPFADSAHLLMRTTEKSKGPRRKQIAKDFEIVMLIGDNLGDFSQVWDGKSTSDRGFLADSLSMKFGSRFIALPCAMYGAWVDAIFNQNYPEKDELNQILHQALDGF